MLESQGGTQWVIPVVAEAQGNSTSTGDVLKKLSELLSAEGHGLSLPWAGSTSQSHPPVNSFDVELETLTLDFESVGRISSEGLNELIHIKRQARMRGVRLVLVNVQEPLRQIFALTRLERMFEMVES